MPTGTPAPSASATPAPTASATPVPTPSPTSLALCVNVGGSTNNFTATQLAGPDNGFSFFNNVIANPTPTATAVPPTPSPTPAAGNPITGGFDCANALSWPAYGSANKYEITISDTTSEQWFNITSVSTRTIFLTLPSGKLTRISDDSDIAGGDPPCLLPANSVVLAATWSSGITLPVNQTGNFGIKGGLGGALGTFDIWIV